MTTVRSKEAQQVRSIQEFGTQRQELGARFTKIEAQNDLSASRLQVVDADRFLMYRAALLSDRLRKTHKMLLKAAQRAENLEQDSPLPRGHEKTALVRLANFISEKDLR